MSLGGVSPGRADSFTAVLVVCCGLELNSPQRHHQSEPKEH